MKTDISVVIVTVCRDSLYRAVRSVFQQDFEGTIHLLIGVDVERYGKFSEILTILSKECPSHITLTPINLGYSTSTRHGGVHSCWYGGSLRTALSFLSSSEWVAYLDDDDWYEPQHLRLLKSAIGDHPWAFTLSHYADSNENKILGIDTIESVGPNKGIYKETHGGFVRPSALLLNKIQLFHLLCFWSNALRPEGDGEDRIIFHGLLQYPKYGETHKATVNYSLDPKDEAHELRMESLNKNTQDIAAKNQSVR